MHTAETSHPTTTVPMAPKWRRGVTAVAYVFGVCLILRALAEPFVIDVNDPSTYKMDWGGPTLLGVMAVHMGFGVAALIAIAWHRGRRHAA